MRVGAHQAYPIIYFGDPPPTDPLAGRANDWGRDDFQFLDGAGELYRGRYEPAIDEVDFELAAWIREGKLLWIAPGDATLTLRSDVRACPYVGLTGVRAFQRVYGGHVWTDAPVSTEAMDADPRRPVTA